MYTPKFQLWKQNITQENKANVEDEQSYLSKVEWASETVREPIRSVPW